MKITKKLWSDHVNANMSPMVKVTAVFNVKRLYDQIPSFPTIGKSVFCVLMAPNFHRAFLFNKMFISFVGLFGLVIQNLL